jgi:ABC-2 type transport system permease protein
VAGLLDTPMAAFAELRFRLTWRRLLGRRGVGELVAKVIGFLLLTPIGLLVSVGVGAGTFRAAQAAARLAGHGGEQLVLQVDFPVTAVFFGLWQAWTAATLAMQDQESLDLGRYLVYPLRPWALWLHGQVAGLLGDPLAVFWCVLLGGAWVGAALGRFGGWLVPLALVLVLFAAGTLAWLALLQELGARVLRRARLKALLFAGVYVALVAAVALVAGLEKHQPSLRDTLAVARWVQWIGWPGAMAASAGRRLFHGEILAALPWIAALAAATAASGWAAWRLALAQARDGGGGGTVRVGEGLGAVAGRLWSGTLGALLEREVVFLNRHPLPLVLGIILPAVAGAVAWKARPYIPAEAGEVVRALPVLGVALYVHLATQTFWLNGFGWERGGARLYFLAPVRLERVLLAKNLSVGALALGIQLASVLAMVVAGGLPPGWAVAGSMALHLGSAPWFFALGNAVAIWNPRVAPLTLQRSGSLPALSALAGMAIFSGVTLLFALPVLVALKLDEGWVLPPAWVALGGLGGLLWWRTLPAAARLLEARREELLAAVTGDEA